MHVDAADLVWDDEMAQLAENYAEESKNKKNVDSPGGCFMEHNPKNKIHGENLAWLRTYEDSWKTPLGEPEAEAADICQGWYDERSFYEKIDPKTNQRTGFVDHIHAKCLDDDICCVGTRQSGHYTQLISKNSKKMGAAVRVCHWTDTDGTKVKDEFWIVMYSPAGNYKNCKTWNTNGTCDPQNLYFMYHHIPEPKTKTWKEEPEWVKHQDKLVASQDYFIEYDPDP
jgi:hypothetical protein